MMTLKIGEKELNVKFGYEATLKSRILSRLAKLQTSVSKETEETENQMVKAEDMLLFVPEFLLIGLQKYHSEEYGFNYDTKEGKDEALNSIFELLDNYFEQEDSDVMELFNSLQEEMLQNGFLAKMFRNEVAKAEQK